MKIPFKIYRTFIYLKCGDAFTTEPLKWCFKCGKGVSRSLIIKTESISQAHSSAYRDKRALTETDVAYTRTDDNALANCMTPRILATPDAINAFVGRKGKSLTTGSGFEQT